MLDNSVVPDNGFVKKPFGTGGETRAQTVVRFGVF